MLLELDRIDEAGTRSARSVSVETLSAGANFSGLAFARNTNALAIREAGHLPESHAEFERALEVAKANDKHIAAQILVHLAELNLMNGDVGGARDRLASAEAEYNEHEIAEGWRYALYQSALGELRLRDCKLEEAKSLLAASSDVMLRRWPNGNLFTRKALKRQTAYESAVKSRCVTAGS